MIIENPDDKCCPQCVEIEVPCEKEVISTQVLSVTNNNGLCVSEPQNVHVSRKYFGSVITVT